MKLARLTPAAGLATLALLAGSAVVTPAPASAASMTASQVLASLTVAAPQQAASYERSEFYTWSDPLGDGCNTRADVLKADSQTPVTYSSGCTVATGQWDSWYDGELWTQASDVDIDHLVPLGEVWKSGAWAWTAAQRESYANDVSIPYALQPITDNINESKGDSDPAVWMPPVASVRCTYDQDWVLVKYKWNLTIDAAEKTAIAAQFAQDGCGATALTVPTKAGTAVQTAPVVTPGTQRVSGVDRYSTAVALSKANYSSGVGTVYVAAGGNYPDALSAASAAAVAGGPLLLTTPKALPNVVATELSRLKPHSIVVVGGTAAISNAVVTKLKSYASTVTRSSGADRYATSRAIATTAFTTASTVFVASGLNFPDALSASAAAGTTHAPVVLVNGKATGLDGATAQLIRSLGATKIVVAGGTSAVSNGVASGLQKLAPVTRLGGTDRYNTSQLVNNAFFPTAQKAYLASGANFPDALAGAAAAGRDGAPLYIVQSNCVPDAIANSLTAKGVVQRVILGGTSALNSAVGSGTKCSALPKPAPKPAPQPAPAPTKPTNPGDAVNCTSFSTYTQAYAWYIKYFPYYGDVANLDGDDDGIPCETLPGAP